MGLWQPWQWGPPHPSIEFFEGQVTLEWLLEKCWWCLGICREGLQGSIYNTQIRCFCFPCKAGVGTEPELWEVADPAAWLRLLCRRCCTSIFWLQTFVLLSCHQECGQSLGKFDKVLGSHFTVLTATNPLREKQGLIIRRETAWIPSRTPSLGTNQWY